MAIALVKIWVDKKQEKGKLSKGNTFNWKKTKVVRGEWPTIQAGDRKRKLCGVDVDNLSAKAKAAYSWLRTNNHIYARYDKRLTELLEDPSTDRFEAYRFTTADLLLHEDGVEVAAYPTFYPRACYADTDLKSERRRPFLRQEQRPAIKTSFLRKCTSRCLGYAKNANLVEVVFLASRRVFFREGMEKGDGGLMWPWRCTL